MGRDAQDLVLTIMPLALRMDTCIINVLSSSEARDTTLEFKGYKSQLEDIVLEFKDSLNFWKKKPDLTIYLHHHLGHYGILYH